MTTLRTALGAALILAASLVAQAGWGRSAPALEGVPRYAHVFVIVEENKDFSQILGGVWAPNIARLAKTYGYAARFYGEVHPSEGNYVALLGGDTYGIHDDDAFYCKPGAVGVGCGATRQPGYVDHTVHRPHIGDQLQAIGQNWRAYFESLPAPGSLAYIAGDPKFGAGSGLAALYASKHSGFVNFESAQRDPDRADHLVGFDRLDADIAADRLPSFALIVPNQCNEMHGLYGAGVPADCDISKIGPLIHRGDAVAGDLVSRLQATKAWRSKQNVAIVITFDEGGQGGREGCCAVTPNAASNYGGGHIPTIVITNHGPRGVSDDTPYNHYSLLRTIEDSFGIEEHLGHAADTALGVAPMTPLFEVH